MADWRHRDLSEDERLLLETVQKAAGDTVAPGAAARDLEGRFPAAELAQLLELGLAAVPLPEEAGGVGLGRRVYVLLLEEVGAACAATAVSLLVHSDLAAGALAAADPERFAQPLEALLAGEKRGGFALGTAELAPGGESEGVRAKREDGGYRLSGAAPWVWNAGQADFYVVAAAGEERGTAGLFLLPGDAAGLSFGERVATLGLRAAAVRAAAFRDVAVPAEAVLAAPEAGGELLGRVLAGARLSWAAVAAGVARAAWTRAARYATERKAFGRPLVAFEGIQEKLAAMATATEAAAGLVTAAALAWDAGEAAEEACALAQLGATRAAVEVAYEAVQVLGGYGFCHEYEVERLQRDAKTLEVGPDDAFRLTRRLVERLTAALAT